LRVYRFIKWTGCCKKKIFKVAPEEPEIIRKIRAKQAKKKREEMLEKEIEKRKKREKIEKELREKEKERLLK